MEKSPLGPVLIPTYEEQYLTRGLLGELTGINECTLESILKIYVNVMSLLANLDLYTEKNHSTT